MRLRVIHALCEGTSVNSTARQTGASKNAILRLLPRIGEGAARLHNRLVRGIAAAQIQADEIWSYVRKKERRVTENDPPGVGEAYCFIGIDVNTRLVLSYLVGRRDAASANSFIADLRSRLTVMPQIVTDGFAPYVDAVLGSFGASVNYAMVNKHFRSKPRPDDEVRYEPPRGVWLTKQVISGAPDMDRATTVHIESHNRTVRTHVRRMTRLSNAFSKKIENHCAALAMHFLYYNFVLVHSEIKTTPAVAAKLTDRAWTAAEMVEACLAEPAAELPKPAPLALPEGYGGAARQLPNGRGLLRVVPPPGAAPGLSKAPAPKPQLEVKIAAVPREPEQLSLFPEVP
ncbi:MAG: IS1 family transposase [Polyangiaceae bacterium]|nr:IS1 family transposase [Polyangiaceae bacterium]